MGRRKNKHEESNRETLLTHQGRGKAGESQYSQGVGNRILQGYTTVKESGLFSVYSHC